MKTKINKNLFRDNKGFYIVNKGGGKQYIRVDKSTHKYLSDNNVYIDLSGNKTKKGKSKKKPKPKPKPNPRQAIEDARQSKRDEEYIENMKFLGKTVNNRVLRQQPVDEQEPERKQRQPVSLGQSPEQEEPERPFSWDDADMNRSVNFDIDGFNEEDYTEEGERKELLRPAVIEQQRREKLERLMKKMGLETELKQLGFMGNADTFIDDIANNIRNDKIPDNILKWHRLTSARKTILTNLIYDYTLDTKNRGVSSSSSSSGRGKIGDGYTNIEINKIMKKIKIRGYKGVYMSDELPKIKLNGDKKFSFIMNLDSSKKNGRHWISINVDNNVVEYFDMLYNKTIRKGFLTNIYKLLKRNGVKDKIILKTNKKRDQSISSDTCGVFSIDFLRKRAMGQTFEQASNYGSVKKGEKYIKKFRKKINALINGI